MEEKTKAEVAREELMMILLYLTRFKAKDDPCWSSWKTYDWDTLDALEEKGFLGQSRKIAYLYEEGLEEARRLMEKYGIEDYPEKGRKKREAST